MQSVVYNPCMLSVVIPSYKDPLLRKSVDLFLENAENIFNNKTKYLMKCDTYYFFDIRFDIDGNCFKKPLMAFFSI